MTKLKVLLVLCFFGFLPCTVLAQTITIGSPQTESTGSQVNPGDVYGTADFVISAGSVPIDEALTGLVRSVISNQIGNNKGSYLLTLELQNNDKVLAVRPIINVTYENERFLFINWSTKTLKDVSLSGNIAQTGIVDDSNNQVDLVIKSYFKSDSSFDMSLFDQLDDINRSFDIVKVIEPTGIAASALGKIKSALMKVLQSSEDSKEHFRVRMAFAQMGSTINQVRSITVPINYTYSRAGSTKNGAISLMVKLWSISSKFQFDKSTKKYIDPDAFVYLNNVRVGTGPDSVAILDVLKQSGEEQVRSFLNSLLSDAGYKGNDVLAQCSNLLANYRKFLSNRDAKALYWATLSEYRSAFKRSHAGVCLQSRSAELESLGLGTSELNSYLNTP